jgi:hypothetical protein
MAQKEALLNTIETLEGARKRSSQAAYKASKFEIRGAYDETISLPVQGRLLQHRHKYISLSADWDFPDARSDNDILAEDTRIVDEFARVYTHLSRPKPSASSETPLKALEAKSLSVADSLKLEAPLSLVEIQKAMYSMARGKSPDPDRLGAECYHAFGPLISIAPPFHQMLL